MVNNLTERLISTVRLSLNGDIFGVSVVKSN